MIMNTNTGALPEHWQLAIAYTSRSIQLILHRRPRPTPKIRCLEWYDPVLHPSVNAPATLITTNPFFLPGQLYYYFHYDGDGKSRCSIKQYKTDD